MSNSNRRSNNGNHIALISIVSIILAIMIGFGIYFIIKETNTTDKNKYARCRSRGLVWSNKLKRCVRGYYK